jgi:predicted acyltransferase
VTTDERRRIAAVDAFRGALVLIAFLVLLGQPAIQEWPATGPGDFFAQWLEPSSCDGVTLADLVMPGFLFIMGISAGVSVERRQRDGQTSSAILRHLLWRSLGLFFVGLVLDGGLPGPLAEIRWLGPFQRIAICNLAAGAVCLIANGWGRLLVAALILVNYGLAFDMIPAEVPLKAGRPVATVEVSHYAERYNIAADVDRRWLPGRKYYGDWDPCGLLTTLPALGLTLLGAAGGCLLMPRSTSQIARSTGWVAALAALALISAGLVLNRWQPLNAWLLTLPFVLLAAGVWGLAVCTAMLAESFPALSRITTLVSRYGRRTLILMVTLQLIQREGPRLLAWASEAAGVRPFYAHSLLAAFAMVALWCIAPRAASNERIGKPPPPPSP